MDNNKSKITHYRLGLGSAVAVTAFLLGFYFTVTNTQVNEIFEPANEWSQYPPVVETIKAAKEKFDLTPVQTAALQEYAECRHMQKYYEEYAKVARVPVRRTIECDGWNLILTTDGGVRDPHYSPYHKYLGWLYVMISTYLAYRLWTRGYLRFLLY